MTKWKALAIHLWADGKTVAEISREVGQPINDVSAVLGEATYAAVRSVMHGRQRAGGYM